MAYIKELEIDKSGQLVIGAELVNYLHPNEQTFYCILSDGTITIVPKNGYKVDDQTFSFPKRKSLIKKNPKMKFHCSEECSQN